MTVTIDALDAFQALAQHEAAHAAAGLLLGMNVTGAYLNDDDPAGRVTFASTDFERDPQAAAVMLIAAAIADGHTEPHDHDGRQLQDLIDTRGVDRDAATKQAVDLADSRPFKRLQVAIAHLLEQRGHLDADALAKVKALVEDRAPVAHTTKAADVTTITDVGEFTALAATYDVDRQGDAIQPGAFARTIQAWRQSGKNVPLHWNHSGDAGDIIGYVDPNSMRETAAGLQVSGKVDLADSPVAREAWRSMRNNSMSLSFGYRVDKSHPLPDGVKALDEIDLFEISIVPIPASPSTRVLAMKSVDHEADDEPPAEPTEPVDNSPESRAVRDMAREWMLTAMGVTNGNGKAKTLTPDELREKSLRLAAEHAPVQIASFEC